MFQVSIPNHEILAVKVTNDNGAPNKDVLIVLSQSGNGYWVSVEYVKTGGQKVVVSQVQDFSAALKRFNAVNTP